MKKGARRRSSVAALPPPGARVARVIPDVAGLTKQFDYLVPPAMAPDSLRVGSLVRVDLHGRRVGAWVTALDVPPAAELALLPLAKVRGWGPSSEVVSLADWAAWRWAGTARWFLTLASPDRAVASLPPAATRPPGAPPAADLVAGLPAERPVLLRLPPATDLTPVVASVAQRGPTLVIVPSVARAGVLADRLRRAGADVALMSDDWARARAGAGVVVGARAAAWAPCPDLAGVVVIDGHDETLTQEGAPTWSAVDVAIERARRAGVPCVITSPCPSLELLSAGELRTADRVTERRGWSGLEVVDRRGDDPRLGLYSSQLASVLRDGGRVVCVLNRTGRIRLLACATCGSLARCERCGAAVVSAGDSLDCPRCGLARPVVCSSCGSTRLRALRVGVSRAREELEALSGRSVGEVTASTTSLPVADVLVGTTAVLHRLSPRDGFGVVAFLDLDQELLAPRVRAGSDALALLAAASRLVAGRAGRVLVQTRVPDHPVVQAALLADPSLVTDADRPLRESLGLPPFGAVALVSGEGAGAYVDGLGGLPGSPVAVLGPSDGSWMVKAPSVALLSDALAAVPRPAGGRGVLRVAVNPARL